MSSPDACQPRCRLAAAIGPGNADQQDTPAAEAGGGTKVYTTRITIRRSLRPVRVRAH